MNIKKINIMEGFFRKKKVGGIHFPSQNENLCLMHDKIIQTFHGNFNILYIYLIVFLLQN